MQWASTNSNDAELDGSGALKFGIANGLNVIDAGITDQYVEFNFNAGGADNRFSVFLRQNGVTALASNTGYQLNFRTGDTGNELEIRRVVSGGYTLIAFGAFSVDDTATYKTNLSIVGSDIEWKINGASVLTVSDSVITTGTYVCIQPNLRTTDAARFYDFRVSSDEYIPSYIEIDEDVLGGDVLGGMVSIEETTPSSAQSDETVLFGLLDSSIASNNFTTSQIVNETVSFGLLDSTISTSGFTVSAAINETVSFGLLNSVATSNNFSLSEASNETISFGLLNTSVTSNNFTISAIINETVSFALLNPSVTSRTFEVTEIINETVQFDLLDSSIAISNFTAIEAINETVQFGTLDSLVTSNSFTSLEVINETVQFGSLNSSVASSNFVIDEAVSMNVGSALTETNTFLVSESENFDFNLLSTSPVTYQFSSDGKAKINGGTNYVINEDGGSVKLYSNGRNYFSIDELI